LVLKVGLPYDVVPFAQGEVHPMSSHLNLRSKLWKLLLGCFQVDEKTYLDRVEVLLAVEFFIVLVLI
jgi:hypothetical protein